MYRTMVTKTQEDFLETKTVERRSLFIDVTGQSRCSSQGSALAASVTLPEYHPCNLLDGKTKFSAFPSRACKHRDIPRKKPRHILARDAFRRCFRRPERAEARLEIFPTGFRPARTLLSLIMLLRKRYLLLLGREYGHPVSRSIN